jgi:hypothetical protein
MKSEGPYPDAKVMLLGCQGMHRLRIQFFRMLFTASKVSTNSSKEIFLGQVT